MKKITILLLFAVSLSYSQVSTTVEEYNYVTKGLRIAVNSGLDLKRGYDFKQVYEFKEVNYDFSFYQVVRTGTNKVCCTMVIANSKLWGNKYYLCIPLNNSDLYSSYFEFLNTWDKDILLRYSSALSEYLNLYLEN